MTFHEQLDNGLVFRTIVNEADVLRYVAFNTAYNNIHEGLNADCLIRHFPGASFVDYQLVEDPQTGEIVSTTCLIPWTINFCGIPLRAGQLEQVLTHPAYRRHGLVRTQIKRFMQGVRERGLDLSFIWGIPYYYRQYGFAYCLDGGVNELLPSARIPTMPGDSQYTLRQAKREDVSLLTELYRAEIGRLPVHIERGDDHWLYLLERAKFTVYIVEDRRSGEAAGYFGIHMPMDRSRVSVIESAISQVDAGMAVLGALKQMSGGEISIGWPRSGTLPSLARDFGSLTVPEWQWLLHITDPAAFLVKIKPVLEERLARSDCKGINRSLILNLFRQAYRLCFSEGRVSVVEALGFVDSSMGADGGDLCIPPEAFVRLVFGFRGLDELFDAWPDIIVKRESRHLLDVLFPRIDGYLYATYQYFDSLMTGYSSS